MAVERLSGRLRLLQWGVPLAIGLVALVYQLAGEHWVRLAYGTQGHYIAEVLLYGASGPLLVFLTLRYLARSVNDRDRAEQQARASERRLAALTAASADAILAVDPSGHVESWNRGAELLLGYTGGEALARPLAHFFPPGESAAAELRWLVERARYDGFVRGHETVCRDAAGHAVDVEVTATSLADDAGRPLGMSIIMREIGERKRREVEVRELNARLNEQVAERTRELGEKVDALARANAELQALDRMRSEFVSLVSHQIRAPLTNMRGAAERMQAGCLAQNDICSRMFDILEAQAARLERLVQDVLSTARLEAGELVLQPEPISVWPVVQQVVEQMHARTGGRHIEAPGKPGLPPVYADRDRVAEVLANLLDNADKYSPARAPIFVDVRADDTAVTVCVCDAGRGLPPKDLERVFDKFYRGDGSDAQPAYGYGLGLYVCKRLVEAQGGRIWAENGPRGGAVFSFTLPVAR